MKINIILDLIDSLTVLELNQFIKALQEKYNINNNLKKELKNENKIIKKDNYSIYLNNIGGNKISVIKIIREINNIGLKESKDLVESFPVLIKDNIDLSMAENIKKRLEETGCVIEIK